MVMRSKRLKLTTKESGVLDAYKPRNTNISSGENNGLAPPLLSYFQRCSSSTVSQREFSPGVVLTAAPPFGLTRSLPYGQIRRQLYLRKPLSGSFYVRKPPLCRYR